MGVRLVCATSKIQENDIEELYETAFPAAEKKPFSIIKKKRDEGRVELLCIEEEPDSANQAETPRFLGLAITMIYEDRVLLDYLAICEEQRGSGVGSQTIALLKQRYQGKRFLLEIESTKEACEDIVIRKRRKAFYERNGLSAMDYLVNLFGIEMEIMTADCSVNFDDYHEILEKVYSPDFAKNITLVV